MRSTVVAQMWRMEVEKLTDKLAVVEASSSPDAVQDLARFMDEHYKLFAHFAQLRPDNVLALLNVRSKISSSCPFGGYRVLIYALSLT